MRGMSSTVPKWRIRFSREVVVPAVGGPDGRDDELLNYLAERLESKGASITGGAAPSITFSGPPAVVFRSPTLVGINRGELAIIQRSSGLTVHYSLDYSGMVSTTVLAAVLVGVLTLSGGAPVSNVIVFPALGVLVAALRTWRSMSWFRAWLTRECRRWLAESEGSPPQKRP